MDFIITVCESAASEACPVWIGHPASAHWGFPDPSRVEGSDADKRKAFEAVMDGLKQKLDAFASLPLEKLDHSGIENELRKLASI
jgi:protein-tyrosine-phosphatase